MLLQNRIQSVISAGVAMFQETTVAASVPLLLQRQQPISSAKVCTKGKM
jgi:hypothetical protein